MNIRAWGIIEYHNEPHIILSFNHRDNTVSLTRWLHPIKADFIRNIAPKLEATVIIDNKELCHCKRLFKW